MVCPDDTANQFSQLMRDAGCHGLTFDLMAQRLEISEDYAKQLWHGRHKISGPIRAKLDALIAAKGDGPGESPYVLEHGEIRERDPVAVDMQAPQPHPISTSSLGYEVVKSAGKSEFAIMQTIAVCADHAIARAICDMLNKEAG